MSGFRTILVANRGEIAVRIMRTAKAMGYRTAAIYSEADADALHARSADVAACVGPAEAKASYLDVPAIVAAAKRLGAGAVHPGYGFLSEDAAFAQACLDAGLVFIGPSPDAIAAMGNKAEAKRRMTAAGVPCVPGYQGADQSDAALAREAERIGFPVMVKAAAGGGGRGMRLVGAKKDLAAALATARAEAESAFASGELILESRCRRPPCRDPDPRRRARPHRASGRTRLFRAATAPEGAGGGAVTGRDQRAARAYGCGRRRRRQGHRLHQRRHGRIPACG
jgi:geranyl-CoA carboxylase alpha subunit